MVQSQAQLLQYCEALNSNSNGMHYVLRLPPISDLRLKFGLDASICMMLYQPKLRMVLFSQEVGKAVKIDLSYGIGTWTLSRTQ